MSAGVYGQSIPLALESVPTHLALDRPTTETKAGVDLTYTVSLKNARNQNVNAPVDLKVEVQTPGGTKTVMIPKGQSSASFTWKCAGSGVVQLTVRAGRLRPATALVLVTPQRQTAMTMHALAAQHVTVHHTSPPALGHPPGANLGAAIGIHPAGGAAAAAPPPPPPVAAMPTPIQAKKLQLFIEPRPVYGSAVDHAWQANISVAAMDDQGALAPVANDVSVHLDASYGKLSKSDFVLQAGQVSNFSNPVLLTADRAGLSHVDAVSSLGAVAPMDVDYLQPLPTQLRLSVSSPVLAGTGASTASVQVCLLDDSGGVTSAEDDVPVVLHAQGELAAQSVSIAKGTPCSADLSWSGSAGAATITAEASGLKPDTRTVTFPSFPWYLIWLAGAGGLIGAIVASKSDDLFAKNWWSHTWRSLVLGTVLGAVFYLFARFGAVVIPKSVPVDLTKIPAVSGVGAILLGFVGGLLGRKLWGIGGGNTEEAGAEA
ncbi:MAG TPA: hypothetical protein VG844_18785 [Terracidiphilus sp.]|nr:hypothetical protein [Terracidiphilus sp.]